MSDKHTLEGSTSKLFLRKKKKKKETISAVHIHAQFMRGSSTAENLYHKRGNCCTSYNAERPHWRHCTSKRAAKPPNYVEGGGARILANVYRYHAKGCITKAAALVNTTCVIVLPF